MLAARRCRFGTATIEFAIMCPVLGAFLMAMVDLGQAIIKYRQLNTTVQQTGLMATQLAVQADQSTSLTVVQLNQASSVIFAIFQGLWKQGTYDAKKNPFPPYAITVSEIAFTPTSSTCRPGLDCSSYTASVLWTVPLQYGQPFQRSCGRVAQVSASADPVIVNGVPTTVPTAGISSALVSTLAVDAMYQYTPLFGKFIGPVTIRQSGYFNQRPYNYPTIKYGGTNCPGVS